MSDTNFVQEFVLRILAGKKPIGKNRRKMYEKKRGVSGVLPTDYNADACIAKLIDS